MILFILPCLILPLNSTLPAVSEGELTKAVDNMMLSISELFHLLIAVLSNTLSYLRILILAVIHELLSSLLVQGSSSAAGLPYIGIPLAFLLMVSGTVIILVEGGIIFIQCIRLQYYEFFSKFYTGGGMKFEPYTIATNAS